MKRFTILAGTVATLVTLPAIAVGAPTGGAVYRPAPVVARPALPQRVPEQSRSSTFTVPFHIDAAPKTAAPTILIPAQYTHRAWTWQPTPVWFLSPCFANGENWAPLQNAGANQSMPEFTIGSLAGNPSHSVLSKSASDIASLASSSAAGSDSPGTTGLKFEWQPSICSQPGMF